MNAEHHPDHELRHDVLEALDADDELSGDIGVRVREGVVTLIGWAHSNEDRVIAERVARHVRGVNTLRIAIRLEEEVA